MQGMEPLVIHAAHRESDEQARLREEQELQEERAQLAVGRFDVPVSMRALPVPVDMSNKVIKKKKTQDRLKITHRFASGSVGDGRVSAGGNQQEEQGSVFCQMA